MDRATIAQRLTLAEQHVAAGESLIKRQRQLVEQISRSGEDSAAALKLLSTLLEIQERLTADRKRLALELETVTE